MARTNKKSVYERIEEKKQTIRETEELLITLNEELQTLNLEKDDLEMRQLLQAMKEKGLTINEALSKFESEMMQMGDTKPSKTRNKKVEKEITENIEE